MANVKISALPAVTTVVPGSDVLPLVSGGITTKATPNAIVQAVLPAPGAIGGTTPNTGSFTNLTYSGTLTGGTGVINIGSGQIYKDASGNVGIGTSSPVGKSDVVSNAYAAFVARASTSGVGQSVDALKALDSAASQFANAKYTALSHGWYDQNLVRQLYLDSSGNLGIGTSSPSAKLHVAGGNIRLNDNQGVEWGGATNFIYGSNSTNILAFATNNTVRATLDSAGNLGLGVTPSAWASGIKAFQVGANSYGSAVDLNNGVTAWGSNYYNDGGNKFSNASSRWALQYLQDSTNGNHSWRVSGAAGTAGNAISFTQAMTLDAPSTPRLLIGTTTAGVSNNNNTNLTVAGGATVYQSVLASGGQELYLIAQSGLVGVYARSNDPLIFGTNNTERARIDSSGFFGINVVPDGNSRLQVVENNSTSRRVADFYLAVASSTGTPSIRCAKYDNNTTTSNKFIEFTINQNNNGSGQINANGAGAAAFGSFSDARLKENITALPNQLANICALSPSEFDYKDGSGHQIGFIAQEMQEVYPDVVGEGEDGMLTITGWSKTEARLVKAIQELSAELNELKAKVNA